MSRVIVNLQKDNKVTVLKVILKMISSMFKTDTLNTFIYCIFDVLHAGGYVLVVICSQKLFDNIALVANGAPTSKAIYSLIFLGIATISAEIFNGLSNFSSEYPSPKVVSGFYLNLYKKLSKVEPIEFENPLFLDKINKAKDGIEIGYFFSKWSLMIVTFYVPYFIFMGLYLNNLSPILIFTLLGIFIPSIFGQIIRFRLYVKVEDEIAPAKRAKEYYELAMCDRNYLKETRILGSYKYFLKLYRDSLKFVNKKISDTEMKQIRINLILRSTSLIGYIGILFLLVHDLINKKISPGSFAAIFTSIDLMFSFSEEVFGGFITKISRSAATIKNYHEIMNLSEENTDYKEFSIRDEISLEDVSFKYPGTDQEVLKNISLSIKKGETIAIVGKNGSGKTTLSKLILGLYRPMGGKFLVDNIDTFNYERGCIYKKYSAVFQNFHKYKDTLFENVVISDLDNIIDENVINACNKADINVSSTSFPNGLNTMLSPEFGGVDISGGQWQRIAISRGLYRKHDLIILDEPTSAIDPIEETSLYKKFKNISKYKTSIIITHRLGSAKIADRIVVLKDGSIDSIGTHDDLIRLNGMYAEMYREQSKWYVTD